MCAARVHDVALRQAAKAAASYAPNERYILFTLSVEYAFMNVYGAEDGAPNVERWQSGAADA